VAPRRKQCHVKTETRGLTHDEIDVLEIRLVGSIWIEVVKGHVSVAIRHTQAIALGEDHGLNHVEPLFGAASEVVTRIVTIESVKELPRRVADPEEGLTIRGGECSSVG